MASWKTARLVAGALAAAFAGTAPAAAEWRRAESANFIVYSEESEPKLREQVALLEDYHDFLRSLTGVNEPPSPNKLPVYILRNHRQLETVRDVGSSVAGFYTANSGGIGAFAQARSSGLDGDEILLHEIAHHFMMQYRPTAYPPWFVEGFAEYVATARFKPNAIEFGLPSDNRTSWLRNVQWLPIEEVLFSLPPRRGPQMALFYAQSWLLAHYVMRDPALGNKFKSYIRARVDGVENRKAFTDAFGEIRAFDRALQAYARKGMTFTSRKRASAAAAPAMTVTLLPRAAEDLLLAEATMQIGVGDKEAPALLERVRRAAARHSSEPYAQRVLARAEVLLGDGAKGDALLDALLAKTPKDAELLYLKGMRHLVAGRKADDPEPSFKQARIWFARAHKADKDHFPTLVRYAESLRTDARFDSDNTLNILLLAHDLAPQVDEVTMNTASLLIARKRFDEAETLLLPLASNPHNEGLAAAAGVLLQRARNKNTAPAEVAAPTEADGAGTR
ncbi:hypothetical protein E2493_00715 [Sphingomonas parva]|uniref:DUF1570 domain-containing protein n=1 Tax=Sphingomonas parva TaxID=2555898 RepID=A0A4Y8ZW66_9SPHN|nr:hypothetical protein [Sphingomonas parva]TFI60268.1 hypothetical protein E2493_00715 [Sphingomonas parva]